MKRNLVFVILGVLFGLNVLAWIAVYDLSQGELEVNFFDVGQGDSIFIETTEHQQILIDGGPSGEMVLEKLGKEMPFWDRSIDLIILTHPEKDHLAGLIEVLKSYQVENILWTGVVRDTAEYQEWEKLIKEEGAQTKIAQAGQQIKLTGNDPVNFEVLYPFESLEGKEMKDSNNTSIIARLVFGKTSFLFTGDVTQSVERQLLNRDKQMLDSDVLKVAHHGSKTANSEEFVGAVSPEMAVISVSKDNNYGHPHPETLETLDKYGITILRTDLNGDIKLLCNSQSLKLK